MNITNNVIDNWRNIQSSWDNIRSIVLECQTENHNKFYILSRAEKGGIFVAKWGKIGKPPQGQCGYTNLEANKKLEEKLSPRKGYLIKLVETFDDHTVAFSSFMEQLGDGWEFDE